MRLIQSLGIALVLLCSTAVYAGGGACCMPDISCVEGYTEAQCEKLGGVRQGISSCDDIVCSDYGACCIGSVCDLYQEQEWCENDGGVWQGDGSDCYTYSCAVGACCYDNGYCGESFSEASCSAVYGSWYENLTCATIPCDGSELGACCHSNGQNCGDDLTIVDCGAVGGTWWGDGSTCSTINCQEDNLGACCYADSCADVLLQVTCEGSLC